MKKKIQFYVEMAIQLITNYFIELINIKKIKFYFNTRLSIK